MKKQFGIDWFENKDIEQISKAIDKKIRTKTLFKQLGIDFIG